MPDLKSPGFEINTAVLIEILFLTGKEFCERTIQPGIPNSKVPVPIAAEVEYDEDCTVVCLSEITKYLAVM